MNKPLLDQNILITGAAGRIGSSVAKSALTAGARLILSDISSEALQTLVKELSPFDPDLIKLEVEDLSKPDGIDSLISNSTLALGRIDSVVHCAYPRSKGWGQNFEDLEPENLFLDLNAQLGGAILLSQKILKTFTNQGHGNLVHISSIQGIQAPKFHHYIGTNMNSPIEYAAIKAGIISITRWLAKYSANKNIRVNCVSPGGILDSQPQKFLDRYRETCLNIGMLSADQVSSAIIFLLSPSSEAINGQNIIVDDGWTL